MKKIIVVFVLSVICLSLSACGKKPEDTVQSYCEALQNFDTKAMSSFVLNESADAGSEEEAYLNEFGNNEELMSIIGSAAKEIRFSIGKGKTGKDESGKYVSMIPVAFEYIDAHDMVLQVLTDYFKDSLVAALHGEKRDENLLIEKLTAAASEFSAMNNKPVSKVTVAFELEKTKDGWKLSKTPNGVYGILFCNAMKSVNDFEAAFSNNEKDSGN